MIDELVEENFQSVNSDEDDSEELIFPSFDEALKSVKTLRKCFMCHMTDEKTFFEINSINNALCHSKRNSEHQTSIKYFFFKL